MERGGAGFGHGNGAPRLPDGQAWRNFLRGGFSLVFEVKFNLRMLKFQNRIYFEDRPQNKHIRKIEVTSRKGWNGKEGCGGCSSGAKNQGGRPGKGERGGIQL